MRHSRQNKLLELIADHEISTQDELVQMLENAGYKVTQATISRDIKELNIIKVLSPTGKYKYSVSPSNAGVVNNRFLKIFKETILSMQSSGNLILVKTLSGCGNAAAEAIDSLGIDHMLGCVAGDNTILIVTESEEYTQDIIEQFNQL